MSMTSSWWYSRGYVAVIAIVGPFQNADHVTLVVRPALATDDGEYRDVSLMES